MQHEQMFSKQLQEVKFIYSSQPGDYDFVSNTMGVFYLVISQKKINFFLDSNDFRSKNKVPQLLFVSVAKKK